MDWIINIGYVRIERRKTFWRYVLDIFTAEQPDDWKLGSGIIH